MLGLRILVVGLLIAGVGCGSDDDDTTEVAESTVAETVADTPAATTPDTTPDTAAPTSTAAPEPPAFVEPAVVSVDALGLSATLEQYREDEVANRLSIKVTNGGDEPVQIETLRLAWPGLADTEPYELDYPVFPGVRVDLRVHLGEAVCSSPPQLVEPTPTIAIAAVANTPEGEITFPVTDPLGILDRVYPRQCKRQAVEYAVGITMGDEWTDQSLDPVEMSGTLTVERRATTEPVTVVAIHGSVVVSMVAESAPVTLGPDDDVLDVPVVAGQNRCDSHALGEVKKPFQFVVDLLIGDDAVAYLVSPGEDGKQALQSGIIGRCPEDTDP